MILVLLIALLAVGGLLTLAADRVHAGSARWLTLAVLLAAGVLLLGEVIAYTGSGKDIGNTAGWWHEVSLPWIPRFGIHFRLALDGLSFALVSLTLAMGLFGLLSTWNQVDYRRGFFYANYLWVLAGIVGVFTAVDLFLFFFFWEVMLIPMLLLIAVWGHERRTAAAIKFFIFTQASSLLMLVSIVTLAFIHYRATGDVTFDYEALLSTPIAPEKAYWLMLGFFIAFAVKLPSLPFHTWLPDAHTQAPTAASILLAAVLLKTGAYGLIRFTLPLFPEASQAFAPVAMTLGAVSIVYGAALAFAQSDMKRLVAYSSVSHMGFVLLGIYAFNTVALQGALVQLFAHGLSTAALFALVGALQHRLHTRDMNRMGGLWTTFPRLSGFVLFFAVASLGLPGLGNFVAEFLVLLGSFARNTVLTIIAALGMIGAAIYALVMVQRSLFGPPSPEEADGSSVAAPAVTGTAARSTDISTPEALTLLALALALLFIGLRPQPLMDSVSPSIEKALAHLPPDRWEATVAQRSSIAGGKP
ncbi:NADH-quinone oxidoreductase subunit M [Microbulbifer aggregans]|uniref:NADH-quinone oxidoreductase subunit M n=1 Tax=Microbulbifer aggregans TaxID=1769779 RepID=A0A1C9W807_9GAMM|nr:NADH-quinone oxidoreductase subunit M [Microbulbifer aggregans]AOS97299.1 NADH-quinone oxidoreductase subunit M [Microbulbifer aggregans]